MTKTPSSTNLHFVCESSGRKLPAGCQWSRAPSSSASPVRMESCCWMSLFRSRKAQRPRTGTCSSSAMSLSLLNSSKRCRYISVHVKKDVHGTKKWYSRWQTDVRVKWCFSNFLLKHRAYSWHGRVKEELKTKLLGCWTVYWDCWGISQLTVCLVTMKWRKKRGSSLWVEPHEVKHNTSLKACFKM